MELKRNPWPLAIAATLLLFMAGTCALVVLACSHKVELVSANYYDQEIRYQDQIDRGDHTRQYAAGARIAYDAPANRITIALPSDQAGPAASGRIELYRPAASGLDRQARLDTNAGGVQSLDAAGMQPGLWKVRVYWTVDHRDYFLEQKVVIGARK